ncbi:MAG: hypothetical protein PHH37_15830 [Paludibacter sp.]|nr:hypothetical protein [Paludibacter sp.]
MNFSKLYILPVLFLLQAGVLKAQSTPEAFLAQLPAIPSSVCGVDTSVVNHFMNQIDKTKEAIQDEIDRFQARTGVDLKKINDKILSSVAAQLGLNMNDTNHLQNENISDGQKNKVIDKSLKNQYGLSMNEVSKVANMSEAEQQQWAQNYANQQMQKAKQNPKEALKNQPKYNRIIKLQKEQMAIYDRINDKKNIEANLLKNIDLQDSIETNKLIAKIGPMNKEISSYMGICTPAEAARSRMLEKQVYNLKLEYCEKLSPMQLSYIKQYLDNMKILKPDYIRLIEIQNELSQLQYGTSLIPDDSDFLYIDNIQSYAGVLSSAYKYWVGKFEQISLF